MSVKKVAYDFGSQYKCPFHEATKRNKIVDQNIQIRRLVMKTCRHQQIDICAILKDDKRSYFTFRRQEKWLF